LKLGRGFTESARRAAHQHTTDPNGGYSPVPLVAVKQRCNGSGETAALGTTPAKPRGGTGRYIAAAAGHVSAILASIAAALKHAALAGRLYFDTKP
jgi:hypothetical protein